MIQKLFVAETQLWDYLLMIHVYREGLDETDIKLTTNEFIKVKESRIAVLRWYQFWNLFALVYLSLILNQLFLCVTFQYPSEPAIHHIEKRWSENMHSNFIKIVLRHGCSPVNLLHIFRTSFFKSNSGRLLLTPEIIKKTLRRNGLTLPWAKDVKSYVRFWAIPFFHIRCVH